MAAMPNLREAFVKIQKERCRELIKIYIDTEVDNDIREQVRDEVPLGAGWLAGVLSQ